MADVLGENCKARSIPSRAGRLIAVPEVFVDGKNGLAALERAGWQTTCKALTDSYVRGGMAVELCIPSPTLKTETLRAPSLPAHLLCPLPKIPCATAGQRQRWLRP